MREALAQVKRDLGPDAVIVSTRTIPARLPGARAQVEISAAPGTPLPSREWAGRGFLEPVSSPKPPLSRGAAKEVSRGRKPPESMEAILSQAPEGRKMGPCQGRFTTQAAKGTKGTRLAATGGDWRGW